MTIYFQRCNVLVAALVMAVLALPSAVRAQSFEDIFGFPLGCAKCDDASGALFEIRHPSSKQYIDAHENKAEGFRVVNRNRQQNRTQYWIVAPQGNGLVTLQQQVNRRYLAADMGNGYRVRTAAPNGSTTQLWRPLKLGKKRFVLQNVATGRFLDVAGDHNAQLVTRPWSNTGAQRWEFRQLK